MGPVQLRVVLCLAPVGLHTSQEALPDLPHAE